MNYIWCISAVLAYRNGSWASSSIGYDDNGFFEVGPSIVQHPDIVSLLRNLGFQTLDPVYDETITSFVYRFQCVVSTDNGDIVETGAASGIPIDSDDLAITRAALEPYSAALSIITTEPPDQSLILNLEFEQPYNVSTNFIPDISQSANHATASAYFINAQLYNGPSSNIPLALAIGEYGAQYTSPIYLTLSSQITILPTDGFTLQMFINLSERTGVVNLNVMEENTRSYGHAICGGISENHRCSIGTINDQIFITGPAEDWQIAVSTPPDDGEWHHLAIRFNSDTSINVLIDGIAYGSESGRGVFYINELLHEALYDSVYRGLICGIKAYNIARSNDQIFADAKFGIPTLRKGIKYWAGGSNSLTLTGKTNVSYSIHSGGGDSGIEVGGGGGAYVSGIVSSVDLIECDMDNERTILSFTGGSENYDAHNIVVYNGAGGDSNGQSGFLDVDETGTVVISNTGGTGCDDDEAFHMGSGGGGGSRYEYGRYATSGVRTADNRAMPGFSVKPGKGGAAINPTLGGRTAATAYGKGGDADLLTPQNGNGGCVIFNYDQGTTTYNTPGGPYTFNTTGKTNIRAHIVPGGGSGGNCSGGTGGCYIIVDIENVGNIDVYVGAGGVWESDRYGGGSSINFTVGLDTIELIAGSATGGTDSWDEYSTSNSTVDGNSSYWSDNGRYIRVYDGHIGERAKLLGLGGIGATDALLSRTNSLGGGTGGNETATPNPFLGLVTIEWD